MAKAGMFSRLDTIILRVRDLERSRVWYQQRLEMKLHSTYEGDMTVTFDLGGFATLTLKELEPGEAAIPLGPQGPCPVFFTDTLEQSRKTLINRGVEVTEIYGQFIRYYYIADPDQNCLQVWTRPEKL